MKNQGIIHGSRFKEVMREQLKRAMLAEAVKISEPVEFYLFNLLTDYGAAGRAGEIADLEEPVGLRLIEAMAADAPEKARALRDIGDTTLLALGLFSESIRKSIVDHSYYVTIGSAAYETLSGIVVCDPLFAEVYTELAIKFASLAEVLSRIAPWNKTGSDSQILSIYRRWLESGDEKLAEQLREAGIKLPED